MPIQLAYRQYLDQHGIVRSQVYDAVSGETVMHVSGVKIESNSDAPSVMQLTVMIEHIDFGNPRPLQPPPAAPSLDLPDREPRAIDLSDQGSG